MSEHQGIDKGIVDAAQALVVGAGLSSLTIDRLAAASGTSRMTLHRRGIKRTNVVDALVQRAGEAYVAALWPALTAPGTGAERLAMALDAICATADDNLALFSGLFGEPDSPFHRTGGHDEDRETADLFVDPLARLLRDGALDGTIAAAPDVGETAAVLFNLAGWGYIHLRHAQGWSAARARPAVIAFALAAVGVAPS
ncbi:MAG: TetR/AcrR family transcriptional regulator [Acidimicrobiales bacterium]